MHSMTSTAPHSTEERNWAVAAHLSALVAVVGIPFGHIVGPLAVYLIRRDVSAFDTAHARAALNFQITVSIAGLAAIVVAAFCWFFLVVVVSQSRDGSLIPVVAFAWFAVLAGAIAASIWTIVQVVRGAIAASHDRPFRYPVAIDFVR